MNNNNIILDKDVTLNSINNKKIAIIGYGNQGRAQALNLKDSGLDVRVGLRENSKSIQRIKNDNLDYLEIEDAVRWADLICLMLPDKIAPQVFEDYIKNNLSSSNTLLFSHGYNIHYKFILPPKYVNVIMVAPSAGGQVVRDEYKNGHGVPALIAIEQDSTGDALELAKSYAKGIGSTRICAFVSTFREETETDIFGEQAILTGGLPFLINSSYQVLIKNGYSPIVAWFVCYYEVKTIVDLFHEKGFKIFYNMISDTARFGGLTRGEMLIDDNFKKKLDLILKDIQSEKFNKELKDFNDKKELPQSFIDIEKQTQRVLELLKSNK